MKIAHILKAATRRLDLRQLAAPCYLCSLFSPSTVPLTSLPPRPACPLQILAAQRALPPAGSPRHEALCERVVQRMGVLLSSGANLEALVLELHQQLEAELAAGAAEGAAGAELAAAVGEAASKGTAAAAAASPAGVELSVVRRMAERIFSTSDTVYQRVQVRPLLWLH